MNTSTPSIRDFLVNAPFLGTLAACWRSECRYEDPVTGLPASTGISHHLLTYHTYLALLGEEPVGLHRERAEILAQGLADIVTPDGVLVEPDGIVNHHPASACHVADALGTFCHYGSQVGWDSSVIKQARLALGRIVDFHPIVREPNGILGRTQQMRFELRAYYWAWRVTGEPRYQAACLRLWENGIRAYQNPMAADGAFCQPSLHPDWTWNYACGAGTTTEYATNTHTPVYYATEPQGFLFVYLHGLREGVFERTAEWDNFARRFVLGLTRNLSRNGHTNCDVDGYGIHRAWFSGCLVESAPVEAAAAAGLMGLPSEAGEYFRWYVDRYLDFVRNSAGYRDSGLPEQFPYGQNITIEKQFTPLIGSRLYAYLARALYEYQLDTIPATEPAAVFSYAWWHNWVRVSTPVYETSFVGTTSLRNIPKAPGFGDANLGCIHGGSPFTNLFVGRELMYATSNDPAGLWQVELTDINGRIHTSSLSSFVDQTALALVEPGGRLLTRESFASHADPCEGELSATTPLRLAWSKELPEPKLRFFVHHEFLADCLEFTWGVQFPRGHFVAKIAFICAVPTAMYAPSPDTEEWPGELSWSSGAASVLARISEVDAPGERWFVERTLPLDYGSPGGENSFCPFPLTQLRFELRPASNVDRVSMKMALEFN